MTEPSNLTFKFKIFLNLSSERSKLTVDNVEPLLLDSSTEGVRHW